MSVCLHRYGCVLSDSFEAHLHCSRKHRLDSMIFTCGVMCHSVLCPPILPPGFRPKQAMGSSKSVFDPWQSYEWYQHSFSQSDKVSFLWKAKARVCFAIFEKLDWSVHIHSWRCLHMKFSARYSHCACKASPYTLLWSRKCCLSCEMSRSLTSLSHASEISCSGTASSAALGGTWKKSKSRMCSRLNTSILMFTFDVAQGSTLRWIVETTLFEDARCTVAWANDQRQCSLMHGTQSVKAGIRPYLL